MREDGRVGKQAVVVAYGVNERGTREVIGIDVVQTESRDSWLGFLRSLVARGLHGVLLVVSDAHEGLRGGHYGRLWSNCTMAALPRALLA
jgi:transposase-like protein